MGPKMTRPADAAGRPPSESLDAARPAPRRHAPALARLIAAVVTAAGLAACATPPPADDPEALAEFEATNDPIEPFNRGVFEFNLFVDRTVLKPAAQAYDAVFPAEVKDVIHNVVSNAGEPVNFANAVLQGDKDRASTALGRLLINSIFGLGGIIDLASDSGLEPVDEDFGQTLAVWGSGEGFYLMLPLLGPSSLRDGIGRGVDTFLDPMTYVLANTDKAFLGPSIFATKAVDLRARNLERIDEIERTSVDFYAAIRSLYRQRRNDLIRNGVPSEDPFIVESEDPFLTDSSDH
jgi:phospholipid-binding lipoprotein MlaA